MGEYQVEHLTLTRLSVIAISKHVWMNSSLKEVLKTCIDKNKYPCEAMSLALKAVMDDLLVPAPAKEDLQFAVASMGLAMWNLFSNFRAHRSEPAEDRFLVTKPGICVDHVCWSVSGFVDVAATMRSLYFAGILRENCTTWMALCQCCIEDCLNDLWNKLGDEKQNKLRLEIRRRRGDVMSAYWIMHFDRKFEIKRFRAKMGDDHYDDEYSLEENLFLYSFLNESYTSLRYFWELLDENQRENMITEICENIESDMPYTRAYHKLFRSELDGPWGDVLMFFLTQLSYYGQDDTRIGILGSGSVLTKLLQWPYDQLFLNFLRESTTHHDSIDFEPLIHYMTFRICCCKGYQFIDKDVKYRRVFYEFLKMKPKNWSDYICSFHLEWFWNLGDMQLLKCILGAEDLKDRRQHLLNELAESCRDGLVKSDFVLKFVKEVLIPGEEQESWLSSLLEDITADV